MLNYTLRVPSYNLWVGQYFLMYLMIKQCKDKNDHLLSTCWVSGAVSILHEFSPHHFVVLFPFYRWENWGFDGLKNLCKVAWLSGRAGIWTLVISIARHELLAVYYSALRGFVLNLRVLDRDNLTIQVSWDNSEANEEISVEKGGIDMLKYALNRKSTVN